MKKVGLSHRNPAQSGSIVTATLFRNKTKIHPLGINNIKSKKHGGMANTL
jgi:hypothetical protein